MCFEGVNTVPNNYNTSSSASNEQQSLTIDPTLIFPTDEIQPESTATVEVTQGPNATPITAPFDIQLDTMGQQAGQVPQLLLQDGSQTIPINSQDQIVIATGDLTMGAGGHGSPVMLTETPLTLTVNEIQQHLLTPGNDPRQNNSSIIVFNNDLLGGTAASDPAQIDLATAAAAGTQYSMPVIVASSSVSVPTSHTPLWSSTSSSVLSKQKSSVWQGSTSASNALLGK